jgi:hypothetical protein
LKHGACCRFSGVTAIGGPPKPTCSIANRTKCYGVKRIVIIAINNYGIKFNTSSTPLYISDIHDGHTVEIGKYESMTGQQSNTNLRHAEPDNALNCPNRVNHIWIYI